MARRKSSGGRVERVLACLVLAVVLAISAAEVQAGKYNLIGEGRQSCGSWTTSAREFGEGRPVIRAGQTHLEQVQWVLGLLSGIGKFTQNYNPLHAADAAGVLVWIDNYCRAHPLEKIEAAATAFVGAHPN